jgi:hypothetical protein
MSAPLQSRHFADQYFLRQYVWPYARASLMQHDSVFGFMDAVPFPDGERSDKLHVGQGSTHITMKANQPNGSAVTWALYRTGKSDDGQRHDEPVCCYPGTVKDGTVGAYIPERYVRWIEQGTAYLRMVRTCSRF